MIAVIPVHCGTLVALLTITSSTSSTAVTFPPTTTLVLHIVGTNTTTVSSEVLSRTIYVQRIIVTSTATYYGTVSGLSVNYLPFIRGCLDDYPDTLRMVETVTKTVIQTLTEDVLGGLKTLWKLVMTQIIDATGTFTVNDTYFFGKAWSLTSNTFTLKSYTITTTVTIK